MNSVSRQWITPAIGLAAGLWVAFHPIFLSGFAKVPGDLWDSRLLNYTLEHSYRFLRGAASHSSYWDSPFFFPTPNVTAYTDTLLSVAPLIGPGASWA